MLTKSECLSPLHPEPVPPDSLWLRTVPDTEPPGLLGLLLEVTVSQQKLPLEPEACWTRHPLVGLVWPVPSGGVVRSCGETKVSPAVTPLGHPISLIPH